MSWDVEGWERLEKDAADIKSRFPSQDLELKERLKRAHGEIKQKWNDIYEMVSEMIPDNGLCITMNFWWECPSSPFGWCAYHTVLDPAHDTCIFCGEPEERK